MNTFSFAFRNVGRHRGRTAITISAMAFAGALMILYASLMEGMLTAFERNAVGMSVGEAQAHLKGYREDPDLYKRIEDVDSVISTLNKNGFNASSRLFGFGLCAHGANSSGVSLRGIDMENESAVTLLNKNILTGSWLDKTDPVGAVIGIKLARSLDVKPGDEAVIVSQAADGSMANDLYHIRGVLKSVGTSVDRAGFFITEQAFRDLMAVGSGAHEIAITRMDSGMELSAAVEKISALLPNYEVKSWRELLPVVASMLDTNRAAFFIMLLITYTAIAMVTLNAMLMSVFERIREFGVMKAIGVTPWQVITVVFTEAMIQAFIASLLAMILGTGAAFYFQNHGIDLSALLHVSDSASIGGVALDPMWYARITAHSVFTPIVVLVVIIALAVIYPGLKAAFIRPVQAIHHL